MPLLVEAAPSRRDVHAPLSPRRSHLSKPPSNPHSQPQPPLPTSSDFTINALFYNLNESRVEDLTGKGLQDLRAGLMRTPLPARTTFSDDPLRALRAVRFGTRLGFALDSDIVDAAASDEVSSVCLFLFLLRSPRSCARSFFFFFPVSARAPLPPPPPLLSLSPGRLRSPSAIIITRVRALVTSAITSSIVWSLPLPCVRDHLFTWRRQHRCRCRRPWPCPPPRPWRRSPRLQARPPARARPCTSAGRPCASRRRPPGSGPPPGSWG